MALPFSRSSASKTPAVQIAEREAAQQQGFYREVDAALREDELRGAFRRYALPVGVGVAAGLLALGGYLWWSSHRADLRAGQAEQIVLALDRIDGGQQDAAVAQLAPVIQDGTPGNRAAARMLAAAVASRQGKLDQAGQLFAQVAGDSQAPQPFRDLATVRSVALAYDRLPPAQVIARLRTLAVPGAPFFGSAGEMVGVAYMKQGHPDMAAPLFGAIARDPNVPETLRARARQLAATLGVDGIDDVTHAPADDAGAAPGAPPAVPDAPACRRHDPQTNLSPVDWPSGCRA